MGLETFNRKHLPECVTLGSKYYNSLFLVSSHRDSILESPNHKPLGSYRSVNPWCIEGEGLKRKNHVYAFLSPNQSLLLQLINRVRVNCARSWQCSGANHDRKKTTPVPGQDRRAPPPPPPPPRHETMIIKPADFRCFFDA